MGRWAFLKPRLTWHTVLTRQGMAGAAALAALLGVGFSWGAWSRVCAAERCPSIARLTTGPGPQQTSKIYAADGRLVTELGLERRTVLPLREIPAWVRQAFLATEDKRFYRHHGIDYWRILGSLKANISSLSYTQGFSTITMAGAQHLLRPDQPREAHRKLKEAGRPRDRTQLLQTPSSDVPEPDRPGAGRTAGGRGAVYFGKSVRDLNVAEAATLAAIPKAPSFNPRLHPTAPCAAATWCWP
jgi:penicillin-binding protein 1A